jgi:hypothetical protein
MLALDAVVAAKPPLFLLLPVRVIGAMAILLTFFFKGVVKPCGLVGRSTRRGDPGIKTGVCCSANNGAADGRDGATETTAESLAAKSTGASRCKPSGATWAGIDAVGGALPGKARFAGSDVKGW